MRPQPRRTRWVDRVYAALADPDRRRVLRLLRNRDAPVDLDELVRAVSDGRNGSAPPESSRTTAIALSHVHLPMLADLGLVRYDDEVDGVARQELPAEVEALLETSESSDGVDPS